MSAGSLVASDFKSIMANANTILVVDDYGPWRQRICSMLEARLELRVVAEAADGLEAVQKAQKLNPDLILLDIGLPILNGIEAAIRILQAAPDTRILFLTESSNKDVVRAALKTGARGYVLKTDAGNELLTAMARILGGDDFVSSGIKRSGPADTDDA
jgi:DNA-binding NarL/FixJ family response regulator